MKIKKAKKIYKNTPKWVTLKALIQCKRAFHSGRMKKIPKFRNKNTELTKVGRSLNKKLFLFFKKILNQSLYH